MIENNFSSYIEMIPFLENFPSLRSLAKAAFFGSQIPLFGESDISSTPKQGTAQACPEPSLSCERYNLVEDTCCINIPGGQFAQTQFWNSDPLAGPPGYLGPNSSWTIHGLWPDHCDGSYDSVCDCERSGDCSSRNRKCLGVCNRDYSSITNIMQKFDQDELLAYMDEYWKGIAGNEHLWQHEWSKHGSCVSTLEPKCYSDYEITQEVVHYFQKTVDVFKTLPSYEWLAAANILPSEDRTYDLADIEAALKVPRGFAAVIGCQGHELREIWYHFIVRGSLQHGDFVEIDPNFSGTGGPGKSCPSSGIRYLPKKTRGLPTGSATTTGTYPTGTSKPSGKGKLVVRLRSGTVTGCLISNGKWYNTVIGSSCASFTPHRSGDSITLRSRKGPCGIENNAFSCHSGATYTDFQVVDGKLRVKEEETAWSADQLPRGTEQEIVYTSGRGVDFEIEWRT